MILLVCWKFVLLVIGGKDEFRWLVSSMNLPVERWYADRLPACSENILLDRDVYLFLAVLIRSFLIVSCCLYCCSRSRVGCWSLRFLCSTRDIFFRRVIELAILLVHHGFGLGVMSFLPIMEAAMLVHASCKFLYWSSMLEVFHLNF